MNPIDHPHGGKTRGGRPLKNIWGKLAKWVPTSTSQIRNST
jgi:ribosomal protein L2